MIFRIRKETVNIEDVKNIGICENDYETFELIMSLPSKYKVVMALFYIEGYKSKEISEIIGIKEEAVRKRLQKGRELLKKLFETEEHLDGI